MDLSERVRGRRQLTTDRYRPYADAVGEVFRSAVADAMLVKIYEADKEERERYSQSPCLGAVPSVLNGDSDPLLICTSEI